MALTYHGLGVQEQEDISYTKLLKNPRVNKAYVYLPTYIVPLLSRRNGHDLLGSPQGCAKLTPESRMKANKF